MIAAATSGSEVGVSDGLEGGDLHLRLRLVDVGEVGEDRAAALQLDEPGRLQHEQAAGLVRRVVRHGDGLALGDVLDRVVLRRVQAERVDRGRADRREVFAGRHVVVGEVDDVLELVEVELALGRRRVRLRVVGEVHDLDRDALIGGGLFERGPLRVALADDADLHDLARARRHPRRVSRRRRARRAAAPRRVRR